eukprot:5833422-Amphidinium_carterae.1
MLMVASGRGWSQFQVDAEENLRPPAVEWPVAVVSVDQGSDGWCATHFLEACRHNVVVLPDMSHRVWNDLQLSLQDSALYAWCLCTLVLMNLDHGPWSGAKWWEQLKQGAVEYIRGADSSCPVFQGHVGQIEKELQLANVQTEASEDEIFQMLPGCVERKQQKVGVTRWFQYITAVSKYLEIWSQRAVIVIYICLITGVFKR